MKERGWVRILLVTMLLSASMVLTAAAADKKSGLVRENGKNYIYTSAGKKVKNVPAYKLTEDGKTDYYRISKNGAATKLTGLNKLAAKRLVLLKAGSKKTDANLRKAFMWCSSMIYRNNTKAGLKGSKAFSFYAKYGFNTHSGDCNTMSYTFAQMAKVLGYKPAVVHGHVPSASSGKLQRHTWVTIKFGKTLYYFDANYNHDYAGKTVKTSKGRKKLGKYAGFKFTYGTPGTYVYQK